jgi:hypothetical protein
MTIIRRGDSTARGHADASGEPVPLAIVPPPITRSGGVRLVPPEDRLESTWLAGHESALRRAYDIGPSVNLFFQEPGSLGIAGGEVTLTERMLMAGVRLPFPKIVREVCAFLGVAPSQIAPNGWRYVVASSILWQQVLGTEMDAAQFFSIYRPSIKDGAVELRVRPAQVREQQRLERAVFPGLRGMGMPFPVDYPGLPTGAQGMEAIGRRLTDPAHAKHRYGQRGQHHALLLGQGGPVVDRLRKSRFSSEPERVLRVSNPRAKNNLGQARGPDHWVVRND